VRRTYSTRIESMAGVASVWDESKREPPDLVDRSDSGDGHQKKFQDSESPPTELEVGF